LSTFQMKFFCSIVLVQRLWRQRSIKKFITDFISPRSMIECSNTGQFLKGVDSPRLDFTLTTEAQTLELIRKYHNFSFERKRDTLYPEGKITEFSSS
jgi:hypothetical protein